MLGAESTSFERVSPSLVHFWPTLAGIGQLWSTSDPNRKLGQHGVKLGPTYWPNSTDFSRAWPNWGNNLPKLGQARANVLAQFDSRTGSNSGNDLPELGQTRANAFEASDGRSARAGKTGGEVQRSTLRRRSPTPLRVVPSPLNSGRPRPKLGPASIRSADFPQRRTRFGRVSACFVAMPDFGALFRPHLSLEGRGSSCVWGGFELIFGSGSTRVAPTRRSAPDAGDQGVGRATRRLRPVAYAVGRLMRATRGRLAMATACVATRAEPSSSQISWLSAAAAARLRTKWNTSRLPPS